MKRPHGYGAVFRRGPRIWWFRTHTGAKAESSRSTRKKDAEAMLDERIAELRAGVPESVSARKTTYEDLEQLLLGDLKANRRRSAENLERYRLPHLRARFGHLRVAEIDYAKVQSYIAQRLESAAPATVAIELKALRRMLTLGHRAKLISAVPPLPSLSVQNARTGFCSPAEIARVIHHLPPHARPIVRTLYLCGWRTREVLELTWARVDFDAQTMRLDACDTKTGKPRVFPFGQLPELGRLLREQRELTTQLERERGAIIARAFHRDGLPIACIRTAWRRAVRAAGLPTLLPHDLRRSAARNLIRAGVSEGVTMALMGHRTRAMFDRYNVTDAADLSEGVGRLSEFLARGDRAEASR